MALSRATQRVYACPPGLHVLALGAAPVSPNVVAVIAFLRSSAHAVATRLDAKVCGTFCPAEACVPALHLTLARTAVIVLVVAVIAETQATASIRGTRLRSQRESIATNLFAGGIIASGNPAYIVCIALEACLDGAFCTASISINRIAVVAFLVRCLDSVAAGTSAAARVA